MSKRWLFAWLSVSLAAFAPVALAYLDPASGSMLLQLLLGGVAGLALVAKLYWHKLLGLFGLKKQEEQEGVSAGHDDTQS